jgi:beta-N-acetylhexosaminidase
MNAIISVLLIGLFSFSASSQSKHKYTLEAYLMNDENLDNEVENVFQSLNKNSIIAQLIMPATGRLGQHKDTIKSLLRDQLIGGVLLLNGTKDQFTNWINEFESINATHQNLPFIYSADAEPSLVNKKIIGSTPVTKANAIPSLSEVLKVAEIISNDLNGIGINYNFAPVIDMAKKQNCWLSWFWVKS